MLEGSRTLLRARHFEFQLRHLLVVVVLVLAFTTAFIMRSYPIKYGFFLNEFDPYFDYRASKFIVDNGLDAYWKWHDTMSWFPEGRDVPKTSQSGLHIVAAYLYQIFGAGNSLLDFTILLPVIVGSLTTIVIFALVRTIGGTTARSVFSPIVCIQSSYNPKGEPWMVQIGTSWIIFCVACTLSPYFCHQTYRDQICYSQSSCRRDYIGIGECIMGRSSVF